jgi:hypothetical protein
VILQEEGGSANEEEMEGGEKNAKGLEVVETIGRKGGGVESCKRGHRMGGKAAKDGGELGVGGGGEVAERHDGATTYKGLG